MPADTTPRMAPPSTASATRAPSPCGARLPRARARPQDVDHAAPDHFVKMLLGIFTWTPRFGRSTSCVTATCPAMLVS